VTLTAYKSGRSKERETMPHIIVTAGNAADDERASVTLRERINASDFESERFATNLVERLGWARRRRHGSRARRRHGGRA